MPRIAYLGPSGTFTEQAARDLAAGFAGEGELVPYDSVPAVLEAVRSAAVVAAGVPVENSVEGSVPATLDSLVSGDPVVAVRETTLPVKFDLLARPGTGLEQVRAVASHPHALAQVREWLATHLPRAEQLAVNSTSAGAAKVVAGECDAAITAPLAAEQYPQLVRLETGIADVPDATTRFLLVQRPAPPPEPTGADRTSIAVVIADEVGALAEVLAEFALRGINLSRIESRPTKERLGEYRFFLDFDGHVADARIGDALAALRRRCRSVQFLGSYPKADRVPADVCAKASEEAFATAAEWLADVRAGKPV
ncbi:prephenate dehydratase [Saccharopolyspora rectivirgula]|uniref:Prephenate dehydratase n=1 Tax=Saccharopolyspora rectivirgula TaxID=28042 RepID=A0A073AWR9_9PSEU|nr:prephenate dehydratase [Saccharopolyspora rectivirgula]KEI43517.1 prephenate dehydratase [Saccharopolyspora rectivirgula]